MPVKVPSPLSLLGRLARPFDTWRKGEQERQHPDQGISWVRVLPFLGLHVACLAVFLVGSSPVALWVALGLYLVRMLAITGFYHRYFSHRTFKTSRAGQLVFAVVGASATQRGPLWWAAHHRHHHRHSDQEADAHSPLAHGFLRAHMTWLMTRRHFPTDLAYVPDLARYPELRFLDRFDLLVPAILALATFALGALLEATAPGLGTSAWQMLVWGYVVSTVVLFHATCTINSLSHLVGSRPYPTGEGSRNNAVLALLTLGEGWHNNHHWFPTSVRQGFRWWQIDVTWYVLLLLERLGIVWDLKGVPARVVAGGRP